jgi:hypothetical protein
VALNWLYGPRTREDPHGYVYLRSLRLDVDTLLDAKDLLNRRLPGSAVGARFELAPDDPSSGRMSRDIPPEDLAGLGQYERRRLTLQIQEDNDNAQPSQVIVSFRTGYPSIWADVAHYSTRDEVARLLLGEGQPLVVRGRLARLATLFPTMLLAGLFIWAEATAHMQPAFHALGWAVVTLVGFYGVRQYLRESRQEPKVPGHLIRPESRADTAARRADTRRDLKVGFWTFLTSIALALVTAYGRVTRS